jgi:SRSO17 transposase
MRRIGEAGVMAAGSPDRRPSRFEGARSIIKVTPPVRRRLDAIKAALEGDRQREVTWSEVIDLLADSWDRWAALADLAADAEDPS